MKMWFRNIITPILLSVLMSNYSHAQEPAKTDSTHLYENIESFSKERKLTGFIYQLVFKPGATKSKIKVIKKKGYRNLLQKPYSNYQGKTIRQINIVTLDPFGYSITDTLAASRIFLIKAANNVHVKSQSLTIRNLLLIRQNQLFDSLLFKESERLVRSRGYVRDVSFYVVAASKNSDSVDVFIRELDNWSIIPIISASTSNLTINLTDKNFLGLGHESKNQLTWYHTKGDYSYNTNYSIPNIRNTYINAAFHYGSDEFRNFSKSFSIDRPFFSPFAKWAAGLNYTQEFRRDSFRINNSLFVPQQIKFNVQDYWAGSSIQVFKGNTEYKRVTNFISSVRFLRIRYLEKPAEIYDTQHLFSDENFYLASIGVSTRKYVQDKFIYKYGVTEDVPVGKVYSLTGGFQIKNNINRFYVSARIAFGKYYPWGYLSTNTEYGTFIGASKAQQGTISANIIYFTELLEIGSWKFRQFLKPQATIGINRTPADSLTLNDGYGLDGFSSSALSGTSRLLFTMQTQSYTPWNLIGFRFGPFIICSFGKLGDEETGFKNSKVYTQFGLGVLIKNENLVINTFQFSLSFYPHIPGKGYDVFKVNSFRTTDFGFRDFEIGKPATIVFQ
jgi:hypothetical protein